MPPRSIAVNFTLPSRLAGAIRLRDTSFAILSSSRAVGRDRMAGGDNGEDSSTTTTSEEDEATKQKAELLKRPKPPLRATNFYIRANYRRMDAQLGRAATSAEIFRHLNEEWINLPLEKRAPYLQQASAEQTRYRMELRMYRLKYARLKKDPSARPPKPEPKRRYVRRRLMSAMQIFLREKYEERRIQNRNSTRRQLLNELKEEWSRMNEDERRPYREMHAANAKLRAAQMHDYQEHKQEDESDESKSSEEEAPRTWMPDCRMQ